MKSEAKDMERGEGVLEREWRIGDAIVLLVVVFSGLLINRGFYLGFVALAGFVSYFILVVLRSHCRGEIFFVCISSFSVCLYAVKAMLFDYRLGYVSGERISVSSFAYYLILPVAAVAGYNFLLRNSRALLLGVKVLGWSIAALVLLQVGVYLLTKVYVDVGGMIFGEPSRWLPREGFFTICRATAFYEEPSTAAAVLLACAAVISLQNPKKIELNSVGLIFISVITLSFAAILASFIFFAFELSKKFPKFILGVFFVFVIFLLALFAYLSLKGNVYPPFLGPIFVRQSLIEYLMQAPGITRVFGLGFFGVDQYLEWATNPERLTGRIASVNDLGAFVHVYLYFGFLGLMTMLFLFFRRAKFWSFGVIFSVCLLKLSVFHPFFLMFAGVVVRHSFARKQI